MVSNCSDCSPDTPAHYQPDLGIGPKSEDCGEILVDTIICSICNIEENNAGK